MSAVILTGGCGDLWFGHVADVVNLTYRSKFDAGDQTFSYGIDALAPAAGYLDVRSLAGTDVSLWWSADVRLSKTHYD